jgi:hypothetical protein
VPDALFRACGDLPYLQDGAVMNERSIKVATIMATAKRPSAKVISQFEHGDFVEYWVPRLGGLNVSHPKGQWKFHTRPEAIEAARAAKVHAAECLAQEGITP